MTDQMTDDDLDVIFTSLGYCKEHIEHYQKYRSYEFKQEQMKRAESAIRKIKALCQNLKNKRT